MTTEPDERRDASTSFEVEREDQLEPDDLLEPDEIASRIRERLRTAIEEIDALTGLLECEEAEA